MLELITLVLGVVLYLEFCFNLLNKVQVFAILFGLGLSLWALFIKCLGHLILIVGG